MKRIFNVKSGIWRTVAEDRPLKMIPSNYRELQELAKKLGIRANQSATALKEQINDKLNT
jgi:hypothetical protein